MPAVADARIVALQAMEDRFKELKLRAASYQNAPDKTFIKHNKGVNTMNLFSKKQIAELHPKFAGYTVLAAGQDESGVHVCLMAEDGSTAVYTMGDLNSVVVPAQITKINAQVEFPFGESGSIQVDACSMTDGIVAELLRTKNNLEQTNESLTCANDEIQKMKDTEKVRRIKAAKEKAVQTLEQFNANREEKIDASILEKINQDIDAGVYSDRVDEDGNWVGDKDVENAVLAECATCVMEFDRKAAASRKNQYIWDQVNQGQTYDDGTVAGLLAKFDL